MRLTMCTVCKGHQGVSCGLDLHTVARDHALWLS